MTLFISLLALTYFGVLAYYHASLKIWTISLGVGLLLLTELSQTSLWLLVPLWLIFISSAAILNIYPLRRYLISQHVFHILENFMPSMSQTEREALEAGTVAWEGEIFTGQPDWMKLYGQPKPTLSQEEREFIDGPVQELCRMIDDWDITHNLTDMPPEMWDFVKKEGFFGLIIPKEYGGKAFSAWANTCIFTIVYGRSVTTATTISVPNSLGPGELLLDYGTKEQKEYYLPRLAKGKEVPCFALTAPRAGSDASSITDTGIVCKKKINGKEVLGIRMNFDKRYITLAPVATVIGLAFKLFDPDHLIGEQEDIGITCALIPSDTKGITVGRRHFPVNTGFLNGPIQGEDVFVPLDHIIGGVDMAGQGWRMLMECLGAGRAVSLPSSALGCAKTAALATGAYARIRQQFNVPIGRFEGIQELLARIAANTYTMEAVMQMTCAIIDRGEKPAVASAIVKYHTTELGRKVGLDAMDIHGGKGICMGPKNYLARAYQAMPIGITVEGANILTRNLIIFGQGAIRCHPYLFDEIDACMSKDLKRFDKAFFSHVGFALSNQFRASILAWTNSYFVMTPQTRAQRYLQVMTRFSAALASVAEIAMATLGANLKRREFLSARLGDILSYLYLTSAILKRYHEDGEPEKDWPIVRYACHTLLHDTQQAFISVIANFPNKYAAAYLRFLHFPFSKRLTPPRDDLVREVAELMINPSETRDRLTKDVFREAIPNNPVGEMEAVLKEIIAAEPLLKKVRQAEKDGKLDVAPIQEQITQAVEVKVLTKPEGKQLASAEKARDSVIAVDDFSHEELARDHGFSVTDGKDVMNG